jgi:hypothetical protein
MFSYIISRLSDAMKEEEYILPRWVEKEQSKKKNIVLKEVVVVKHFNKYEFFQSSDKFSHAGKNQSFSV